MTKDVGRFRACGMGDPVDIIGVFARLRASGEIPDGSMLELPRIDLAALEAHFDIERHEHWSILWTRAAHPPTDGDGSVVRLSQEDDAEIDALLDLAFPATHNRPGRPGIHRWFGVREGGTLVAVGADRSVNGVGYIVAVAVHPSRRGHGFGAAVTRRLVREVLTDSDLCALGVVAANQRARTLYRRIGFSDGIDLTSIILRLP
ncbi:GNAT family N-acetyltransferase [Allorhizocola rhizosphaerae]|uniref:GNAT family N-acetyltransferase n=1 Tax=Allorhizocola rhizosphaerae TaxID=1872709 RepID=UPI000E3CE6F1|nr:GNAT family N-acetyltransferase [Allorhizocola rhizosphaerae]